MQDASIVIDLTSTSAAAM